MFSLDVDKKDHKRSDANRFNRATENDEYFEYIYTFKTNCNIHMINLKYEYYNNNNKK